MEPLVPSLYIGPAQVNRQRFFLRGDFPGTQLGGSLYRH